MISLRFNNIVGDLSNIYNRAYYVHKDEVVMTSSLKKICTGGITGGLEMLKKIKRDYLLKGGKIYILVDSHKNAPAPEMHKYAGFRKSVLPAYKSNRDEKDPEFYEGLSVLKHLLLHLGDPFVVVEVAGVEADDLVAPLLRQNPPSSTNEYLLVSNDEDWAVNIQDHVVQVTEQNGFEDVEAFTKRKGFDPRKVALWKTFRGDASDGIPKGCLGIRKEVLFNICENYNNISEVMDNLYKDANIPDKWKIAIKESLGQLKTNEQVIHPIPIADSIFNEGISVSSYNQRLIEICADSIKIPVTRIDSRVRFKSSRNGTRKKPLLSKKKLPRI